MLSKSAQFSKAKSKSDQVSRSGSFSILAQNVQYLKSKINEIEILLSDLSPTLACFTELALSTSEIDALHIDKYKILTFYVRKKNKHKQSGGVGIFLRADSKVNCSVIDVSQFCSDKVLEASAISLNINAFSLTVVTVYRSPKHASCHISDFLELLEGLLNNLLALNQNLILCGDLNIDLLTETNAQKLFLRLMNIFNLKSYVNTPTRIGETSATCIDHVFSNWSNANLHVETISTAVSDHFGNFISLPSPSFIKDINESISKRVFKDSNFAQFEDLLKTSDWSFIYSEEPSLDTRFSGFLHKVVELFNVAFPKRNFKIKNDTIPSWFNEELKAKKKQLRLLYGDVMSFQSSLLLQRFKAEKKLYKKQIRRAKKKFFSDKLESSTNKVKSSWSIINSIRNTKKDRDQPFEILSEGTLVTDPTDICEVFNRFFGNISTASTAQKEVSSLLDYIECSTPGLDITRLEEEDIEIAIKSLKNKTASGEDEISVGFISRFSTFFCKHLLFFFNGFIASAYYPTALKISKIRPLFKKGDTKLLNNYRPIALTSSFSKIFEKALAAKISSFMEDNKLFHTSQFGYRNARSTADAVNFSIDIIAKALEKRWSAVAVFLDLSKAFDKVEFHSLLAILAKLGFSNSLIKLVQSFLSDRKQYVFLSKNGTEFRSTYFSPTCSVPQGSILGPLLFIIYVNFLPLLAGSTAACMFCDDTTLIYTDKCSLQNEICMFSSLNGFIQALDCFNLTVNQDKTKFMNFKCSSGGDNSNVSAFIGDFEVEQVSDQKFLGVWIDDMLTWNQHVSHLLDKLSSSLFLLKRIARISNLNTRIMMYHSLFHSHISYCLIIWGGTSIGNINSVFSYQKKAVRLVFHLKNNKSCKSFFQRYNIFTIFAQYIYQILLKVKQNEGVFDTIGSAHQYNTRHGHLLKPERSNLMLKDRLPFQNGIKYFNLLPLCVRSLDFKSFKKKLKAELISLAPYGFDEIEMSLPTWKIDATYSETLL